MSGEEVDLKKAKRPLVSMIFDNSKYGSIGPAERKLACLTPIGDPVEETEAEGTKDHKRRKSCPTVPIIPTNRLSFHKTTEDGSLDCKAAANIVADAAQGFVTTHDSIHPRASASIRPSLRASSCSCLPLYVRSTLVKICAPFGRTYTAAMILLVVAHCCLLYFELPASKDEELPPRKTFRALPYTLGSVELLIVLAYLADMVLMILYKGFKNVISKRWIIAYFALVILFLVDIIKTMLVSSPFINPSNMRMWGGRWATRPLRSLFLVYKVRTLRRMGGAMFKAALKVAEVVVLALVLIIFYSVIGVALFAHDYEAVASRQYRDSFSTFGRAALSLTVLLTTENFPQIFFPALFGENGPVVASLYFLSYFFFGVWVLFNLILAVIFDSFQDQRAKSEVRARVREGFALLRAYDILTAGKEDDKSDRPKSSSPKAKVRQKPSFLAMPSLRKVKSWSPPMQEKGISYVVFSEFLRNFDETKSRSLDKVRVMFRTLSRPGTRLVFRKQWLSLLDVLNLRIRRLKQPGGWKPPPLRKAYTVGVRGLFAQGKGDKGTEAEKPKRTNTWTAEKSGKAPTDTAVENDTGEFIDHTVHYRARNSPTGTQILRKRRSQQSTYDEQSARRRLDESESNLRRPHEAASQSIFGNLASFYYGNGSESEDEQSMCAWIFDKMCIAAVYANTIALCFYERIGTHSEYKEYVNLTCQICAMLFLLELLWRSSTHGLEPYATAKPVCVFVMVISLPSEFLAYGRWLAILRSFRVIRVVTVHKRLSKLMSSILGSLQSVLWLLVLLIVIFYVFVVIGMEMFSFRALERPAFHKKIENFDSFWPAVLSLFQITSTNNWNDVMFTVLPDTRLSYSLFFIIFYFLVCMVILNVVTTLIIQGFSKNQEYVREESWTLRTLDGVFEVF
ncbi:hypothetical protein AAMO2058_000882900 [Amorphochlora amoebiformis]